MLVMGPEQRQYQIGEQRRSAMTTSSKIQAARFHRERVRLDRGLRAIGVGHIQRSAMSGPEG